MEALFGLEITVRNYSFFIVRLQIYIYAPNMSLQVSSSLSVLPSFLGVLVGRFSVFGAPKSICGA